MPVTKDCQVNDECTASQYCAKDAGSCESTGVCTQKPDFCTAESKPVCGCDGKTYSNKCMAAVNGVNVDYVGACDKNRCWSNDMCGDGNYCNFSTCAAETGVCMLRPDACPFMLQPVCGCDGKTYTNECSAAAAGVSVAYAGICK